MGRGVPPIAGTEIESRRLLERWVAWATTKRRLTNQPSIGVTSWSRKLSHVALPKSVVNQEIIRYWVHRVNDHVFCARARAGTCAGPVCSVCCQPCIPKTRHHP